MIVDLYGIGVNTTSIIVGNYCETIEKKLRPIIFPKPTLSQIEKIAIEFEASHGSSFILGDKDGSHILDMAPPIDPKFYYCHKVYFLAHL